MKRPTGAELRSSPKANRNEGSTLGNSFFYCLCLLILFCPVPNSPQKILKKFNYYALTSIYS